MSDQDPRDPLFKKQVIGWFGSGRAKDEQANKVTSRLPEEIARLVHDAGHDTPLLLRWLDTLAKEKHNAYDSRILESYTQKLKAATGAASATIEFKTKLFEASRLETELERKGLASDRAEELAKIQHETAVLEAQNRQQRLKSGLPNDVEDEELRAKIETAKADQQRARAESERLRRESAPPPPPAPKPNKWQNGSEYVLDEVNGYSRFMADTTDALAELNVNELAEIDSKDPRAEEKKARAEANHRARVQERDRIARELWKERP
jgi:hypothetical protein